MTQRFLLILLLLGIFRISSAQIGSLDIDDQTQNRALLQQKIYQLPDFDKIDYAEIQSIEETFQIPSFHIYQYRDWETDRKSTRLNSSHSGEARMPSSA